MLSAAVFSISDGTNDIGMVQASGSGTASDGTNDMLLFADNPDTPSDGTNSLNVNQPPSNSIVGADPSNNGGSSKFIPDVIEDFFASNETDLPSEDYADDSSNTWFKYGLVALGVFVFMCIVFLVAFLIHRRKNLRMRASGGKMKEEKKKPSGKLITAKELFGDDK